MPMNLPTSDRVQPEIRAAAVVQDSQRVPTLRGPAQQQRTAELRSPTMGDDDGSAIPDQIGRCTQGRRDAMSKR